MIWPIPATQGAHYAAVVLGMAVILWFCGYMRGRPTLLMALVSLVVLLLAEARTALLAAVMGLFVAGLSLVPTSPRVRRTFAIVAVVGVLATFGRASVITHYLARGQSSQQLTGSPGGQASGGRCLPIRRDRFQISSGSACRTARFGGCRSTATGLTRIRTRACSAIQFAALIIVLLIVAPSSRCAT